MAVVASRRGAVVLLVAFLALAAVLAIDPPGGRFNWFMGNVPTLVALAALAALLRRHPLSWTSLGLLFAFLALHELGVHFGYRVPGPLDGDRNQYDRLVHVAFGLLLTGPTREALVRAGKAAGGWATVLSVSLVLAMAAFYEVTEWVGAELLWPGPAEDFLGFQGDALDATKDMALALGGSIAAAVTGVVVRRVRA